eukprot:scaffold1499_cov255-Pinguiococcus_pyrenoidosus.AAC.24
MGKAGTGFSHGRGTALGTELGHQSRILRHPPFRPRFWKFGKMGLLVGRLLRRRPRPSRRPARAAGSAAGR